jgi:hypothetical protein
MVSLSNILPTVVSLVRAAQGHEPVGTAQWRKATCAGPGLPGPLPQHGLRSLSTPRSCTSHASRGRPPRGRAPCGGARPSAPWGTTCRGSVPTCPCPAVGRLPIVGQAAAPHSMRPAHRAGNMRRTGSQPRVTWTEVEASHARRRGHTRPVSVGGVGLLGESPCADGEERREHHGSENRLDGL